jgi:glycosyltransferase involved in cell wall biosynthesis
MKVSICIPAYRQIKYLRKLLDSIAIQTYTNFEIILTDDTPDDSVYSFIKSHFLSSKISYFKNNPAKGSPANWNEAIRLAKGEYIKIMHHDDWFNLNYSLERFISVMDSNPETQFAFSASKIKYAFSFKTRINRLTANEYEEIKKNPVNLFLANRVGGPSATIFRGREHMFFDERLVWLVDIDFYISFFSGTPAVYYIDEPLICTITNATHSITTRVQENALVEVFENFYVYKKHNHLLQNNSQYSAMCIAHLRQMLKKYNINSEERVRETGYCDEIPQGVFSK